jgi:hypothetical protein
LDTITFTYFGSTIGGTGSFTIDLGHFVTLDGEVITGVSLASNGLVGATPSVSFNGTDALFKQSTTTSFNAIGGKTAVFDVTTATTPLPAALPLFATGIGGLGLLGWRRKRKALAVA